MKQLGLLVIRVVTGGLLAGHGAQKLFGWFDGPGLEGTSRWLESMGMRPGRTWALFAGLTEFGGGLLTALGALNPIGPILMLGPMSTAIRKVHWKTPIWAAEGGAELPVLNMSNGIGLALTGPGTLSVDRLLGIRVPRWFSVLTAVGVVVGVAVGVREPSKTEEHRPVAAVNTEHRADEQRPDAAQTPPPAQEAHESPAPDAHDGLQFAD
jgi:putative oxidoreductase